MKDRTNQNDLLTLEQQEKEAKRDSTGRIRRYLDLAERLLRADDFTTADAA
ncbi:MAG TPA: hypothetical protein VKE71_10660 [Candidatus Angelobacter sp.]|nr:hypothetical protein [Candidatus Angelobacter sp.]